MTTYYEFKRFEELAERLGFVVKPSKYHYNDAIAIYPTAEKWPCYDTGFEFWSGSIEEMTAFMRGIEKALQYAEVLGWNRKKAEENYIKKVEKQRLCHEKKRVANILSGKGDPGEFKPVKV